MMNSKRLVLVNLTVKTGLYITESLIQVGVSQKEINPLSRLTQHDSVSWMRGCKRYNQVSAFFPSWFHFCGHKAVASRLHVISRTSCLLLRGRARVCLLRTSVTALIACHRLWQAEADILVAKAWPHHPG